MLLGLVSHYFFGITIFVTSVFLILLVLVQRGRGGGIAGALGGAGGQSAFGTKAGDLFTRITVGVATAWILLCCLAILVLKDKEFSTGVTDGPQTAAASGVGSTVPESAADASEKPEVATPIVPSEAADAETTPAATDVAPSTETAPVAVPTTDAAADSSAPTTQTPPTDDQSTPPSQ